MPTANEPTGFGAVQLAFADARLGLAVANHLRYKGLEKVFGVPREQANALTFVLALTLAGGGAEVVHKVFKPIHLSGGDTAAFGILAREAAFGIAGPASRTVPRFGSLMTLAIVGGAAVPLMRRAAHKARLAEQRVRHERERRYREAMDVLRSRATA